MSRKRLVRLVAVLLALVILLVGVVAVYAATAQHTKSMHFRDSTGALIPGTPTIDGSSVLLLRTEDGVSINVNTTEMPEGAFSNWWVIFDNPGACATTPCSADDFPVAAVDAAVFFATGGVVGHDGTGHFRADLAVGQLPPTGDNSQWLFGTALDNPMTAEVHYVIRYHGPYIAGLGQTTTFGGGCDVASRGPFPNSGPAGDFFCYDNQAAVIVP